MILLLFLVLLIVIIGWIVKRFQKQMSIVLIAPKTCPFYRERYLSKANYHQIYLFLILLKLVGIVTPNGEKFI